MRKTCALLVVLVSFVLPLCSFAESSPFRADADEVISTIETLLAEGFEYSWVYYNETINNLTIDIAYDGLVSSLLEMKQAGYDRNHAYWVQTKGIMLIMHDELSSYLSSVGWKDTNLIVQLVNDDAFIRNDYSTIQYNPLFSATTIGLRAGLYIDFME